MPYKLAVKNIVIVPVKFSIKDGKAKAQSFAFTLSCERVEVSEMQAAIKDDDGIFKDEKIAKQMVKIATGWEGQDFVLEEDGTPAAFSEEAFEVMLGVPSVLGIIFKSYMKESTAVAKN